MLYSPQHFLVDVLAPAFIFPNESLISSVRSRSECSRSRDLPELDSIPLPFYSSPSPRRDPFCLALRHSKYDNRFIRDAYSLDTALEMFKSLSATATVRLQTSSGPF